MESVTFTALQTALHFTGASLQAAARLFVEMAPYLLLGFLCAGLVHLLVPESQIKRHIGGKGPLSTIKAALLGVPLPLCSCGVIPTGLSLRKMGASKGATISFLVSTPQTGVDSILATYGMMGWIFAVFRPVAAFVSGITGGLLADALLPDDGHDRPHQPHCCAHCHHDATEEEGGRRGLAEAWHFAFHTMIDDTARWLMLGILIAGVIETVIPADPAGAFFGSSGIAAMLLVMAAAIPMYVCSTSSIPIAVALIGSGFSPGTAFVFLTAGPATNTATVTAITRTMGSAATAIYLGTIALSSLGAGLLLDEIYTVLQPAGPKESLLHGPMLPWWMSIAASLALAFLLLRSLYRSVSGSPCCAVGA